MRTRELCGKNQDAGLSILNMVGFLIMFVKAKLKIFWSLFWTVYGKDGGFLSELSDNLISNK